jgi:hypothetical protein
MVGASLTVPVVAAEQASASIVVHARFHSRTSLRVSARLLQFEVPTESQAAIAAVDFSAGARTAADAEVVLSVEAARSIGGPGGAADVETSLSFSGEGDGTRSGSVGTDIPTVAGRWTGSGLRTGRLVFTLRAAAPGAYSVPLRFVLSTP